MDQEIIDQMKSKWKSALVARSEVRTFTGGAIGPGHVANEDCRGRGPKGRFVLGRRTVYPVDEFCKWLSGKVKEEMPFAGSGK